MSRRVGGVFLAVIFMIMTVMGVALAVDNASAQNPSKTPDKLFSDVPNEDANYIYIRYAVERGILQGFPDGSFQPGEGLTRAQAAVVMVKAAGLRTSDVSETGFEDVSPDHWAAPYVKAGMDAGYIKGYPDGTYKPEAKLSRAEGISLVMRLCTQNSAAPLPVLQDMDSNHWAAADIGTALALKMIGLSEDGKQVYPGAQLSRGSLARALAILLTRDPVLNQAKLTGNLKFIKGEIILSRNNKTETLKKDTSIYEGDIIKTAKDSQARILYPDGSSTLIEEDSEIVIKTANGRHYIKQNGTAGIAVEYLNLDLKKGTMFGALATNTKREETVKKQAGEHAPLFASRESIAQMAAAEKAQPWYQTAEKKKVKVKVDMPWGVAAIRGTFIKVTVNTDGSCTVSCLTGSAEVSDSNGSSSVPLGGGQSSGINQSGATPGQAAPMSEQEKQQFSRVQDWIVNTALAMDVGQEADITPVVVIVVEIPDAKPGEEQVQEKSLEPDAQGNNTEQQAADEVNTAVEAVLNALQASGIELKPEVIEDLKQQIQEVQNQLGKTTTDALQTQVNQTPSSPGTTTTSSSSSNSGGSNLQSITYNTAGTYGPADTAHSETINGNVIVAAAGVTLQNMIITGSLALDKSIGEGDVTLSNVQVQGNTSINGGGSASIHIMDCQLSTVTVDKENNQIRIAAQGNTSIGRLSLNSGAVLEETALSGPGFSAITIGSSLSPGTQVLLNGNFDSINIQAPGSIIQVISGNIGQINISPTAGGINLNLGAGVKITSLVVNGNDVQVTGNGWIQHAAINAPGARITQIPDRWTIKEGISSNIGGREVSENGSNNPSNLIYNQDGFGFSGTIAPNPLQYFHMTAYNYSSAGSIGLYAGGVFDGQNIWMIPLIAGQIIKIDTDTGAMTGYGDETNSYYGYMGGVFDGQNIWMIPLLADQVIKIDKDSGTITEYSDWPSGFAKGEYAFMGGVFDGQNIWMIPHNADRVIKMDKDSGTMTSYNNWPDGFVKGDKAFMSGVFDGQNIWMIPHNADRVIKMDKDSGTMTGYNNWPDGFAKGDAAFAGGAFDGQNIWMIPYNADRVIKIDKDSGTMTGYRYWPDAFTKGDEAFIGGVFDGQNIWMIPASAKQLVKGSNLPNVTLDPIDDQIISPGSQLDISLHSDPYDASINANSSDDSIVTVSINGHILTITGKADGTATITVTAASPGLETALMTFTVTVDSLPPVYKSAVVSNDYRRVTLKFDEAIYNNTVDDNTLKAAITFAADDSTFKPLTDNDSVTITGTDLIVNFAVQIDKSF